MNLNLCDKLKNTSLSSISHRPHQKRSLPLIDSNFGLYSIDSELLDHDLFDLPSDLDDMLSLNRLHLDNKHSNQELHRFDNSEIRPNIPIENDSDYFEEIPHSSSRSNQSSSLNFLPSHFSFWEYVLNIIILKDY